MGYAQSIVLHHPQASAVNKLLSGSRVGCLLPFTQDLFILHLGVTSIPRTLTVRQKAALAMMESLGFQGYCLRTRTLFRLWDELVEKRATVLDEPEMPLMALGGLYVCPYGPDLAVSF